MADFRSIRKFYFGRRLSSGKGRAPSSSHRFSELHEYPVYLLEADQAETRIFDIEDDIKNGGGYARQQGMVKTPGDPEDAGPVPGQPGAGESDRKSVV